MFSPVKIEQLLQRAEDMQARAHEDKEVAKQRVLRGGSSGHLSDDGVEHGECSRRSLLRFVGISDRPGFHSRFYFNAGLQNEDRWSDLLEVLGPGSFLRENECPVYWTISHPGTGEEVSVGGRPDIVQVQWNCANPQPHLDLIRDLAKKMDEAKTVEEYQTHAKDSIEYRNGLIDMGVLELIVGYELKMVCSSYRATKVFIMNDMDAKHVTQAAHYSWQLGIPWILSYTSESSYDTPYWAIKKYGAERKIKPGRQHYYLGWNGDQLMYVHPESGEIVPTAVTKSGIQRYYEYILAMETTQQLGPRPSDDAFYPGGGDQKPCQYCVFLPACDSAESKPFVDWVDAARAAAAEGVDE